MGKKISLEIDLCRRTGGIKRRSLRASCGIPLAPAPKPVAGSMMVTCHPLLASE